MIRRQRGTSKYLPYIRTGIKAVSALQRFRTRLRERANAKYSNNNSSVVTSQRDVKTTKKRKYNKKLAKKQRAFATKVQKALLPKQELNVYSETHLAQTQLSYSTTNLNVRGQTVSSNNLFLNMGKKWSTDQNAGFVMGRYQNIAGSTDIVANKSAKSTIPSAEFKLHMMNSSLDISITNPLATSTQPTLYDIYECVAAQDISVLQFSTPVACWQNLLNDNYSPTDGASNRPTVDTNGQTPYDCPMFGKYWKILKKTRLYLGPGTTSEIKISSGKYTLSGDKFEDNYAIAGISKGVIIIAGIGDNTNWPLTGTVLRYVAQKTWHFKYEIGESELPQRPTVLVKQLA